MPRMTDRPVPGQVEERSEAVTVEGRRIRGRIPYGVESRDLGGFRETISQGALRGTNMENLICTVEHAGVPLGRFPATLTVEDRDDGMHWSIEPPASRQDVVEAVQRGDYRASSWRMVVARDRWQGEVRHVEAISELRDVSIVANPAYPAASVEMRSHNPAEAEEDTTMADTAEQITQEAPGAEETAQTTPTPENRTEDRQAPEDRPRPQLRVEDRSESDHTAPSEDRVMSELADAIRTVNVGESRALSDAISLTPTAIGTVLFDRLRASSVVLRSGIRTISMGQADSIQYPSITGDVAAGFTAEGAAIAPSDPTFASITATPRKLAALVQMSNEVIDDSVPALLGVLNTHLATILSLKLDQMLLEGDGSAPNVRGLKNIAAAQSLVAATNGAAISFDTLAAAIALLEAVNVPIDAMALIVHTRNIGTLRTAKASTAGTYLWSDATPAGDAPRTVFGVPVLATSQLSTNETTGTSSTTNSAYLLDTRNVVWVSRQAPQIVLDRSRLFNSDQSELRVTMRGDLIAPIPNAIVRVTGFTS